MPSVTPARSPPSPSPRSSAPSAPSAKRDHTSKNMTDMRLDKLPNLNAYVNEIAKFEIAFPCLVLLMVNNEFTDVTWRMPVGYNNSSKGHQAPSHEASSEGKSASNNVDGGNTDGTEGTARMLGKIMPNRVGQ